MLLLNLLANPFEFLFFIIAILMSITIHEAAHAWVADISGDPTAKNAGRISLNPLAHLDPWGTVFLLLFGFGWGKPVPINPLNFKNQKFDELKVSLAGPASNLALAACLGIFLKYVPMPEMLATFLMIVVLICLTLMVFNLLPIPPLDGSAILSIFLTEQQRIIYQQIGMPILFGIIILGYFGLPILSKFLSFTVGNLFYFFTNIPMAGFF